MFSHEPEPDDVEGGPRPHVPSNLGPTGANEKANRVNLFLEDTYYNRENREETEAEPPAPGEPPGEPPEELSEEPPQDAPGYGDLLDDLLGLPAGPGAPLSSQPGYTLDDFLLEQFERVLASRE